MTLAEGGGEFELKGSVYLGYTSIEADGTRGFMILGKNESGGYYEILVGGIDYTPEPNQFYIAILRLYYTRKDIGVVKMYEYNEVVDDEFSPVTNFLPGKRVGLNWTAIVAADNRPYGETPIILIIAGGTIAVAIAIIAILVYKRKHS